MELLVVSVNAVVVAAVGGILAWVFRGRFEALDHRIDRLETRINGRFETLQASVDAMRSDLTQVALAVRVRPRAQDG